MSDLKTKPTGASVAHFISAIPDPVRRGDCRTLVSLMRRATGARAEMWGPSIVGFGHFHYRYGSGREGDWFLAGFSPRKQDLTVYVVGGLRDAALLAKLGRHKASTGCLYLRALAEVDLTVLETLVTRSAAALRAMHAPAATTTVKAAKPAARAATPPAAQAPATTASARAGKAIKTVKAIKAVKPAKPKRAGPTLRVGAPPAARRGR
jgi:hypothetical protein